MPAPKDHAIAATDAIHALNLATLRPGDGWTEPADAYDVIGALADTARLLPQTIGQAQTLLARLDKGGHLAAGRGDADAQLCAAYSALLDADTAARQLASALDGAHCATNSLVWKD